MAARWEEVERVSFRSLEIKHISSNANQNIRVATERMKVPGGWLVRTLTIGSVVSASDSTTPVSTSMVFLPDPNHDWKLS